MNENIRNQWTKGYDSVTDYVSKVIEDKTPCFEYVGGYTGSDGSVYIRCKECGHIQTRSMVSIRHGKVKTCENCKRIAKETEEAIRTAERIANRSRRNAEREEKRQNRIIERLAWEESRRHNCPVCGTETIKQKYCSEACRRKATNHMTEAKRRAKIKNVLVDSDIEIHKLFNRDGGICHICGQYCDWEDYTTVNGTIICGDNYPSIDHVIPLSRGGLHSWDNVMLAHRYCNYLKNDKLIPTYPSLSEKVMDS